MRVLLLVLTACWRTSQPPPPPPQPTPEPVASSSTFRPRRATDPCRRTIDVIADKHRAELAKTGIPEATIDELIEALIESCRATDWSPDLLSCYETAADTSELDQCQSLMTAEQTEDATRRMMDVISRMSGQPPPPPPPPPPGP